MNPSDAKEVGNEDHQLLPKYVWLKGLRSVPRTIMWPAKTMCRMLGDKIRVYIRSDHAEILVKMKDILPIDKYQLENFHEQFIRTLRKKRLISTLNELKEDIEWIKEEMSEKDRDSNETHEDDQNENSDVHLSNQTEEMSYESEKDRDSNETHEDDQNENSDVHLSNQTEEMRYESEKDRDSNETHEDDQNENSDVHLSNQTEEKRYESEKDRDSNETHEDDQNENSDVHLSNQTEEKRYESEKDRDSNETHEDDQNENSDVHLSNQTEEKRYESKKDRDSNETHEDDQNENSDVHLSNQTEEMHYESEKDRDSNETHEDDQNENSDVHLSNQTEEMRYESEKDRDSNETHEDDQNENSDVHLSNQTEEMRYESEKDRDSNETHEDDQNENSDVHLSNQTESETDDDSQQNTVDCDADSDYVPDSEDECENLEALPAFLNAVMKETGTESNDIVKDSDLKEKPYERKKKLKEEEKIRDSKCNGIYIKKYQKTDDGVYGQKKDSRPYDTVHACKFCYKLCTHIQDHLEKHNDNKEVQSIIKLQRDMKKVDNKGPLKKEIKRLQDCLRFEGDHLHNLKVKEFKEGELLIQRKACSKEEFNFLEYGPCSECLQWIKLESSVFNHQKNCPKRDVSSKSDSKNSLIWQARILTGEVETSGSEIFKKEVLVKMRKDAVSDCAKGDFMIRNLGEVWLAKSVDHKLRRARIASFQMRLASRLVLECRKRLKNDCLSMFDLLRIKNFDLVADATLHLCGKNEDDDLRSPSVATKVGFDLVRLAGLKGTYCLRQGDADERKEAKGFLTLMKVEWSTKVTRLVNSLIRQRHFENRRKLPHPKDIETVASNLSEKLEKYDYKDKSQFVLVAKTVVMRLMVYNRRRSGEMEELLIKTYMERNRGIDDVEEALLGELTYTEKYLIRSQELMWIRGKRGKPVPVLIPPDASKALEYLVDKETRQLAGRKPDNRYLFATNGDGVIYVSQCLKEHGFEHADKLIHPERLTSTGYRAYMATIAQCIGLKDHQIQWLCTHLGHTENVHMTNYRFTLEGIERIQMGKLLLMQDKNLLPNYKGMSLEEIEFEDIVSKMESQPQPRIDGNGAEMDVDDESFPGTADSDAHEDDLLSDVTMNGMKPRKNKSKQQVKRKHWTEKELEEIQHYAGNFLQKKKTPNRNDCQKIIKRSQKDGGELSKRTPELIMKKISAMNMKAKKMMPMSS